MDRHKHRLGCCAGCVPKIKKFFQFPQKTRLPSFSPRFCHAIVEITRRLRSNYAPSRFSIFDLGSRTPNFQPRRAATNAPQRQCPSQSAGLPYAINRLSTRLLHRQHPTTTLLLHRFIRLCGGFPGPSRGLAAAQCQAVKRCPGSTRSKSLWTPLPLPPATYVIRICDSPPVTTGASTHTTCAKI